MQQEEATANARHARLFPAHRADTDACAADWPHPATQEFLRQRRMPGEELHGLDSDPHEITNCATSLRAG